MVAVSLKKKKNKKQKKKQKKKKKKALKDDEHIANHDQTKSIKLTEPDKHMKWRHQQCYIQNDMNNVETYAPSNLQHS